MTFISSSFADDEKNNELRIKLLKHIHNYTKHLSPGTVLEEIPIEMIYPMALAEVEESELSIEIPEALSAQKGVWLGSMASPQTEELRSFHHKLDEFVWVRRTKLCEEVNKQAAKKSPNGEQLSRLLKDVALAEREFVENHYQKLIKEKPKSKVEKVNNKIDEIRNQQTFTVIDYPQLALDHPELMLATLTISCNRKG